MYLWFSSWTITIILETLFSPFEKRKLVLGTSKQTVIDDTSLDFWPEAKIILRLIKRVPENEELGKFLDSATHL